MTYESAFLKKLIGEALPKPTKGSSVSFVSSDTRGFPENTFQSNEDFEELKTDHGLSGAELETLRLIYQETIDYGSAHHSCKSPDQAKGWCEFLNYHLPSDRDVCVIRNREINTYKLTIRRRRDE